MVSGGASGLLPSTPGEYQLALLRGPQTLRSLLGTTRGRYRHSRVGLFPGAVNQVAELLGHHRFACW
eukprot:4940301-Amphidinium_carterae.1